VSSAASRLTAQPQAVVAPVPQAALHFEQVREQPTPRREPVAPTPIAPAIDFVPIQATRPRWTAVASEPVRPRVEVTVGSIEIIGPEPGASPPPVAVAPAPVASAPSGFDDFASLRSYAPWGR
jgi:hypothetical protein